jgi:hypothetical protein
MVVLETVLDDDAVLDCVGDGVVMAVLVLVPE